MLNEQEQALYNKTKGNSGKGFNQPSEPTEKTRKPRYNSDRTQSEAKEIKVASDTQSQGIVEQTAMVQAQQYQVFDGSLALFEQSMSDMYADRISMIGTNISILTAEKLKTRQREACLNFDPSKILDAIDVPHKLIAGS